MNDNFNRRCRPRLHTRPWAWHFGAGSGGDPGAEEQGSDPQVGQDTDGSKYLNSEKDVFLLGNQIHLQTGTAAEHPMPYLIQMLAIDRDGDNGRIQMRGSRSVRITSGLPLSSGGPSISNLSTSGIDIVAGNGQDIYIERGVPGGDLKQTIQMLAEGVLVIDGDAGKIDITSAESIMLGVAGGTSSIELTPAGIVIKGPLIRIN